MSTQEKTKRISERDFENHDCHLSQDDGCAVCEAYALQKLPELMVCPHGMCDGSGYYEMGEFDEVQTVKCLCKVEAEQSNDEDDDY